jgi:hypothetical protein
VKLKNRKKYILMIHILRLGKIFLAIIFLFIIQPLRLPRIRPPSTLTLTCHLHDVFFLFHVMTKKADNITLQRISYISK